MSQINCKYFFQSHIQLISLWTAANKVNENEDGVTAANPDGFFADFTNSVSIYSLIFLIWLVVLYLGCLLSVGSCKSETSRRKRTIWRHKEDVHHKTRLKRKS